MEERRQSISDRLVNILQQAANFLIGQQGRKASFGVWLFWVATSLRVGNFINEQIWWWCTLSATLLIGFGTIMDRIVEKLGDSLVQILSTLVGSRLSVLAPKTPPTTSTP